MARRLLVNRFACLVILTAPLACFFLPFLTASSERVARATGIELVTENASLSGRYIHAAYEGEVELVVEHGHIPALVAFVFGAAALLAWWPRHWLAPRATLALGIAAVVSMLALWQTTSARFVPVDRHSGFWLATLLFLLATVAAATRVAVEPRSREPERRPEEVPPWLRY